MFGTVRAAIQSPVPGSAVPKPSTVARVAADSGFSIPELDLESPSYLSNGIGDVNARHNLRFNLDQNKNSPVIDYDAYYDPATGERAMIPVYSDPITNVRTPFAPPPPGFISANAFILMQKSFPAQSFISWVRSKVGGMISWILSWSPRSLTLCPPSSPACVTPVPIRQPVFNSIEDEESDSHDQMDTHKGKLSTKALSALQTDLSFKDITTWLIDFETALGRVDKHAHTLLTSPDWRLLSERPWAQQANMRIADSINAALNPKADNVILYKSHLRDAQTSDRPGILYSGMDMLEEIRALVDGR